MQRERHELGARQGTQANISKILSVETEGTYSYLEKNCSLSPKRVFKALHVSSNWSTTCNVSEGEQRKGIRVTKTCTCIHWYCVCEREQHTATITSSTVLRARSLCPHQ